MTSDVKQASPEQLQSNAGHEVGAVLGSDPKMTRRILWKLDIR